MRADIPVNVEAFLDANLPYRIIRVEISPAEERRLRHWIERFNDEVDDDPMNPYEDTDLSIAITASSNLGLSKSEDDAGVWTDRMGHRHDLPRARRASRRNRLGFAWRAAKTAWRSN